MERSEIIALLRWWVYFDSCGSGDCAGCAHKSVCHDGSGLHEPSRAMASHERFKAACREAAAILESGATEPAKAKRAAFTPPTAAEVAAYCKERGNRIDPDRFCDYYNANGWRAGKSAMKDWRAAVRNWERMDGGHGSNQRGTRAPEQSERAGDYI